MLVFHITFYFFYISLQSTDPDLKRCLSLSTEDLRFVDHLMKGVENPQADGRGTDAWIREQLESYFTSLLRTVYDPDCNQRELESFNEHFCDLWLKTNNYQSWLAKKITASTSNDEISAFDTFPRGHPFTGSNINVGDFRNKIAQLSETRINYDQTFKFDYFFRSLNNTQSARKINQAVNSTFLNAKSSFNSWLSNFTQKEEVAQAQDAVLGLDEQADSAKSSDE